MKPNLSLSKYSMQIGLAEVVDAAPPPRPSAAGCGGAGVARGEQRRADGRGRLRPRGDEVAPRGAHRVHHRQAGDARHSSPRSKWYGYTSGAQHVQRLVADEQQAVEVVEHLRQRAAARRELGRDAPLPAEDLEQADGGGALLGERDAARCCSSGMLGEELDRVDGAERADGDLRQQRQRVGVARELDRRRQRDVDRARPPAWR